MELLPAQGQRPKMDFHLNFPFISPSTGSMSSLPHLIFICFKEQMVYWYNDHSNDLSTISLTLLSYSFLLVW